MSLQKSETIAKKTENFSITAKKAENFADWYQQVVLQSELLHYYGVPGFFIMRPNSMFIWSEIRRYFDDEVARLGVQECYFPMLVLKKNLELEKAHLANFDPELAWITRCGNKALDEPVAVRPTSETIMYPYFAEWLKSYRDLPLKLNQWCSVLRWEVKSTLPFIRGREFLWQEGHTAFYREEEAKAETFAILDIYAAVYRHLLAVPVTLGTKSKKETFGGADYTLSAEAFIPGTGRGVQAATSHHLGVNFARIFDVKVETESKNSEKQFVFQNSWGLTTRSLGIAAMIHSDNRGFVCPPRVAQVQVVVVPCGITAKTTDKERADLSAYSLRVLDALKSERTGSGQSGAVPFRHRSLRVHLDDRAGVSPGFKYNHWELRGVPLRIEIGFKEMAAGCVCLVRRDTGAKAQFAVEGLADNIYSVMDSMHDGMFQKALTEKEERTKTVGTFEELKSVTNSLCLALAPWCKETTCEDEIKEKTTVKESEEVTTSGVKTLCIPFDAPSHSGKACVNCGKPALSYTLFGRSY